MTGTVAINGQSISSGGSTSACSGSGWKHPGVLVVEEGGVDMSTSFSEDMQGSVPVPRESPVVSGDVKKTRMRWWRKLMAFVGPGYLVAVG